MKNLVIIGVSTKGVRETKTVTGDTSKIISNPVAFGFAKISAVMTEKAFNETIKEVV